MKKIAFSLLAFAIVIGAQAQSFRGTDKSPMDMAYYPDNFAHDRKGDDKALVRVIYSRPMKNNREVFGNLAPYGKVWRTGANEATEIKFYADATVGGQKIKAGTYSLFSIPDENEWTIIFNSDLDYWGAYSYKEQNDVLRVKASVKQMDEVVEAFSIQFEKTGANSAVMKLAWDTTVAELPITF